MLLAFAIVIAVLGISITLALGVFERTREIGLMRAVGMNRRQTRRTVRWEAIIVSTFGAIVGIVVGTLIGVALSLAVPDTVIDRLAFNPTIIILILVGAVIAGVLAALYPSYKASNMNVLRGDRDGVMTSPSRLGTGRIAVRFQHDSTGCRAESAGAAPVEVVEEPAWPPGAGPSACRPGAARRGADRDGPGTPGTTTAPGGARRGDSTVLAAPRAALTGAGVHGPTDTLRRAQVRPQQPGGDVDQPHRVGLREVGDPGERAQLARPQHLAPVHVAEPAEHPLVEQHLGDGRLRVVVGEQRLDAPSEIGVRPAEVGPEPAEARMAAGVGVPVGLDDGGVEAHGLPPVGGDERAQVAVRAPPCSPLR